MSPEVELAALIGAPVTGVRRYPARPKERDCCNQQVEAALMIRGVIVPRSALRDPVAFEVYRQSMNGHLRLPPLSTQQLRRIRKLLHEIEEA